MTTHHLWLVTDCRPIPDRIPPELVACTIDEHPHIVAGVPLEWLRLEYIGVHDGGPILPRTSSDNRLTRELREVDSDSIFDRLESERRGKRGG